MDERQKKKRIYDKEYRGRNLEHRKKLGKVYYQENQEDIKKRAGTYYLKHKKELSKRAKERSQELKIKVLSHYSGNPPTCVCCGESFVEFLSIDHMDGGGRAHCERLKMHGGFRFYRWLEKNDFPAGYRVLCMNCNFALGRFGYCPHERIRRNCVVPKSIAS